MRSARALSLLLAAVLGAACVVVPISKPKVIIGNEIVKGDIRFIESGVTSRSEVIEKLGPPDEWRETERVLIYQWTTQRRWLVGIGTPAGGDGGTPTVVTDHWLFVQIDSRDAVEAWTIEKAEQRDERDRILRRWLDDGTR